jgi:putative membrane protein
MIRKILLNTLICGGMATAPLALAQAPGGAPGGGGGQAGGASQPMPERPSASDATAGMNNPDTMTRKVDDKKFLKEAATGGLIEVELGKLAAQKGSSDGVKKFGQKMVDDHGKANDQLKEVAAKSQVEVPSSIDSKHQSQIDKMSKLEGPAFDKAYIKNMVKDHDKDVAAFKLEAQNGQDPNVKQFAASTLPTLQEHQQMIKELKDQAK